MCRFLMLFGESQVDCLSPFKYGRSLKFLGTVLIVEDINHSKQATLLCLVPLYFLNSLFLLLSLKIPPTGNYLEDLVPSPRSVVYRENVTAYQYV